MDEFFDSYEFKIIKRVLKREYSWIIDVENPSLEKLEKYDYSVFINLFIDPYKLQKLKSWVFNPWAKTVLQLNVPQDKEYSYFNILYDISFKEGDELSEKIIKTMNDIIKSNVIPQELRMPSDIRKKRFKIDYYIIPKGTPYDKSAKFAD